MPVLSDNLQIKQSAQIVALFVYHASDLPIVNVKNVNQD